MAQWIQFFTVKCKSDVTVSHYPYFMDGLDLAILYTFYEVRKYEKRLIGFN